MKITFALLAAACTALGGCVAVPVEPGPVYRDGRLARHVRRNPQRDEFLRARTRPSDDGVVLEPVTGQESHMIVRAAAADALVYAPRGEGELAAGERVRYLPRA